jgi:hypothetical protein
MTKAVFEPEEFEACSAHDMAKREFRHDAGGGRNSSFMNRQQVFSVTIFIMSFVSVSSLLLSIPNTSSVMLFLR